MKTADEALSREIERGMTRDDVLRRAAALGIVISAGTLGPLTEAAFASTQIKRGGTFRQATAGGTTDFIDGQHIVAKSDIARLVAGFDGLARFDEKGKIRLHLAEELKAEKANQYLIRVRKGVEFHNGKTLTIDDVIYSIKRTKNPKLKLFGYAGVRRDRPQRHQEARQVDGPAQAVAAGRDADGGIRAVLPGCRPEGLPAERGRQGPAAVHRDRAVQGQELHARTRERPREERELLDLGPAVLQRGPDHQLPVRRREGQRAPVGAGRGHGRRPVCAGARREGPRNEGPRLADGRVDAACMRVDVAPFDDVRVRRAFRLLINRPQVVQQGLSGYGFVGNDIYSPFDPAYAGDEFPQRKYDPEQAKSLLKQAGHDGLTSSSSRARRTPGWSRAQRSSPRTRRPAASTSPSGTSTAGRSTATST